MRWLNLLVVHRRRLGLLLPLGLSLAAVASGGCAVSRSAAVYWPNTPKSVTPLPIVHCFDSIGHRAGSKPYLLGGSCVCSPSQAVLDDYQKHGYLTKVSLEELKQRYRDLKLKTIDDHQHCNNACASGPHWVKGGYCMVPPTPGTQNYEDVFSGKADKVQTTPGSKP